MKNLSSKSIVLVTRANQGIGFQVAKQILTNHDRYHVIIESQTPHRGEAAALELQQQNLSAEAIIIDVTDDDSIATAVQLISSNYGRLDVLINNAGISNDSQLGKAGVSMRSLYIEQFDTNVFGAAQVTETFLPLLEKSSLPHIVFTSSGLGSLTQRADENDKCYSLMVPIYRASKAALNMLCLHYAAKYKNNEWK